MVCALLACINGWAESGAMSSMTSNNTQEDSLRISLVTCYPGPEIYELYGHSAIRVVIVPSKQNIEINNMCVHSQDIVFNYGIFSFDEPNFAYRFAKGVANYCLEYYPFNYFIAQYKERGSRVEEQVLELTTEQKQKMLSLLFENAEEENKYYRYNYILDNCSTRPRDIIEKVVGESLQWGEAGNSKDDTFRKIMHRYDHNYAWEVLGIDLALGHRIDEPITLREKHFVPMLLEQSLIGATMQVNGKRIKVADTPQVLVEGSTEGTVEAATPWYIHPLAWASVLLLITIAITVYDYRHSTLSRWYDSILLMLFAVLGCVIYFLIYVSIHEATSPNWVSYWVNPCYILPLVLIWIRPAYRVLYWYTYINLSILVVLLVAGWCLWQDYNATFYPLIASMALRQGYFVYLYRRIFAHSAKEESQPSEEYIDTDNYE